MQKESMLDTAILTALELNHYFHLVMVCLIQNLTFDFAV